MGVLIARWSAQEDARRSALTHATHTDPLTGIDNRRVLDQALGGMRPGDAVVDIDEFRAINTARGHSGGDTVLAETVAPSGLASAAVIAPSARAATSSSRSSPAPARSRSWPSSGGSATSGDITAGP